MWFVLFGSAWLITLTAVWLCRQNRYWHLTNVPAGPVKQQIVRLPLRHIHHRKLRHEIKIFNRLCLVMPVVKRVAVVYQQQINAILKNPNYQPPHDPYARLFYGYACYVLSKKTASEILRRQLKRNLTFLLAPKIKIVRRMKPVWLPKTYALYHVPIYKIFNQTYVDPQTPDFKVNVPLKMTVRDSYIKYDGDQITIKRFANFYELKSAQEQTLTLTVAKDKADFDCVVNRGVVTCKNLVTGNVQTFAVRGEHVRLATSVCARLDALQIYVVWHGTVTISVNHGTRALLTTAEIQANRAVEKIVDTAYRAKYIAGEKLRQRYQAAEKCVPSLRWLTRVVNVTQPDDIVAVINHLADYRRAAQIFGGFNLVFLYVGTNQMVADLVGNLLSETQVTACRQDHLLLYFIDRTTTEPDALYFFTKLTKPNHYEPLAPDLPNERTAKTYPYVKTLTVTNPQAQPLHQTINWPLKFNGPQIITANGQILTAVGLFTGKSTTYHLPMSLNLRGEHLTTHLNLPLKVKLMGFETRQFSLTRQAHDSKTRLRKKDLLAAMENIVVHSDDAKLDALFAKPVIDQDNPNCLHLLKAAEKNVDRKLFMTILEDKNELPMDVWEYLMTKIVGIRVTNGKIHLVPCVNLIGEFSLSFSCRGENFTFNTRKNLPKRQQFVTIPYGQKIKRN